MTTLNRNQRLVQEIRQGLRPLGQIISPTFIQVLPDDSKLRSQSTNIFESAQIAKARDNFRRAIREGRPATITKDEFNRWAPKAVYRGINQSLFPESYVFDFVLDQIEMKTGKAMDPLNNRPPKPSKMQINDNPNILDDWLSRFEQSYEFGSPPMPPEDVDLFMLLVRLQRPVLSDEEIRLMPSMELIGLYYSLQAGGGPGCKPGPSIDPVLSRGFNTIGLGNQYEFRLASRIYYLRPDIRSATDANGKMYRILLDPQLLFPKMCTDEWYDSMGFKVFTGVLSLVGGPVGLVAAGASAYGSYESTMRQAKALNKVGKLQSEIAGGMQLAVNLPNPIPQPEMVAILKAKREMWRAAVNQLIPIKDKLFSRWRTIPGLERMFGMDPVIGLQRIDGLTNPVRNWRLYPDFFYSPAVKNMVDQPTSSTHLTGGWFSGLIKALT